MTNITTPFAGTETTAQVQTKLSAIANYWSGTSTALSGAGSWGAVRAILNNFANAANQINNLELASSFITKLNWLNDSDNMFAPLFSSGQQGLWYDPSDLTTDFQVSTGTTPVTAAGDPVGLILDKHEGLVPGPELLTNGTFATNSDWSLGIDSGGTIAISSGLLTVTRSTGFTSAVQAMSFVSGKTYKITATARRTSGTGSVAFLVRTTNSVVSGTARFTALLTPTGDFATYTGYYVCSNTETAYWHIGVGTASAVIEYDTVSAVEIPGNHATQATPSARPILARVPLTGVRNICLRSQDATVSPWGFDASTGSGITLTGGLAPDGVTQFAVFNEGTSTGAHRVNQGISTAAATAYTISAYIKAGTSRYILLGTTRGGIAIDTQDWAITQTIAAANTTTSNGSLTEVGGGVYRASVSVSHTTDTSSFFIISTSVSATPGTMAPSFAGTSRTAIFTFCQFEVGSTATAYQKVVSQYDVTESGVGESWRLVLDKTDDHMDVTLPSITGTMVLATPQGTAAYGFSRGAGTYEIGGRSNGLYFPGTALVGQIIRNGAMSAEEITRTVTFWQAKGGGGDYGTVTNFSDFWRAWNEITSFPLIDTSSGTDFTNAWRACTGLTSFPSIDTSAGTIFNSAWRDCSSLTSFPAIDTSSGTNFNSTWLGCSGLTSFPLIDTSAGTNFFGTWYVCTSLTSFPAIDTGAGTNFQQTWQGCTGLTSFPAIDTSSGTNFNSTWLGCTGLTTFPANVFDTCPGGNFTNAFLNTNLSQTSIDNILVSLATAGVSTGTRVFNQSGGSAPSATGNAAIDTLRGLGWTVTVTGGY